MLSEHLARADSALNSFRLVLANGEHWKLRFGIDFEIACQ